MTLHQTLTNCHDDITAKCKINAALKREDLVEASAVTDPALSEASQASFRGVPAVSLLLSIGMSTMISVVNFN